MKDLYNTTTLFVGSGTGVSDKPDRFNGDYDPAILFVILAVLIVGVMIRWINKR